MIDERGGVGRGVEKMKCTLSPASFLSTGRGSKKAREPPQLLDPHHARAAGLFGGFGGDALPALAFVLPLREYDAARCRERHEAVDAQFAELFDHPVGALAFGNGAGNRDAARCLI